MAVSGVDISTSNAADLAYVAASRRTGESLSESLDFESYLTIMVAQLQNQDMYNTADTSEMTAQLAQYSLVSAADSIMQMQNTNYAASLVGQQVTASYEDTMGNLVTNIGTVTGVTLYEGEPLIYVNGIPYNLSEIMIIGSTQAETEETESDTDADADTDTGVDGADADSTVEGTDESADTDAAEDAGSGSEGVGDTVA